MPVSLPQGGPLDASNNNKVTTRSSPEVPPQRSVPHHATPCGRRKRTTLSRVRPDGAPHRGRGPGARGCGVPPPVPAPPHAKTCPPAGPNGAVRSSCPSSSRRSSASSSAPRCSSNASVSAGPTDAARTAWAALARSMSSALSGTSCPLLIARASGWTARALRDVVEDDADGPLLAGHGRGPLVLATAAGEGDGLGVGGREVVGQHGAALTRHAQCRLPRSTPRPSIGRAADPRRRRGRPGARGGRSPAWARRAGGPASRSPR